MFLSSLFVGAVAVKVKNEKAVSDFNHELDKVLTALTSPSFSYEEKISLISRIRFGLDKNKREISKIVMKSLFKPISEVEKEFEAVFKLLEDVKGIVFTKEKRGEKPLLAILPFDTPILSVIKVVLRGIIAGSAVVIKPSSLAVDVTSFLFKVLVPIIGRKHLALLDIPGRKLAGNIKPADFGCIYIGGIPSTVKSFCSECSEKVTGEVSRGTVAVVALNADIDQIVGETVSHAFSYNGQYCSSQKGLIIPENIAEIVISKLREKTERFFVPGDPSDSATTATPLVDTSDEWYAYTQISDAVAEGAELIFGGEQPEEKKPFKPVIISGLRPDHKLVNEDYRVPYLWIATYQEHPDDFIQGMIREKRVIVYGEKGTLVSRLKATTGWEVFGRDEISGFFNWEGDNPYKWLKASLSLKVE